MIVSATHPQIRIALPTNRFTASDERVLCWGRVLLTLEANEFRAGDEYFSAGDECIENVFDLQPHTRTASLVYVRLQQVTSYFHTEFMLR